MGKIYTFKDLQEMGININTLRERFYRFPRKYGVKNYKKISRIKGINEETFHKQWEHLLNSSSEIKDK